MNRRILAVIAAVVALSASSLAEPAWACSCAGYATAEEHVSGTDVIFRGVVVRSERVRRWFGQRRSRPMMITTFAVVRAYKGAVPTTVRVAHPEDICCVCGLTYRPGQEVVVFAHGAADRLSTSACSRPRFDWPAYEAALARTGEGTAGG